MLSDNAKNYQQNGRGFDLQHGMGEELACKFNLINWEKMVENKVIKAV